MNKYLNIIICIFYLLFFSFPAFSQVLLRDEFVEETLAGKELPSDKININYNYEDLECIPIKLKIDKKLSTKELLQEGDTIVFRIRQDVKQDRKIILRKDTIVTAKIEAFLSRGMNGIPGQIIIDNFEAVTNEEEITDFLIHIAGFNNVKVIVISKNPTCSLVENPTISLEKIYFEKINLF